ncbi:MAG: glutamine-hydrolyzing carbamoyl-phosphate synthase small subunit, partial [Candidatus Aenigmarchaeota archaeon]|nr:glutamine-hydrolyzing carbamoyl-phosphate synthase small subunit [Candidatus Aenigmarchaeota archaeon]
MGAKGSLVLEDGTVFEGISFGYPASSSGEVVFNTGMVGYPESLTDPSYRGQILSFTYPMIGNYGVPRDRKSNGLSSVFESESIHVSGVIVSDYSENYSHWNAAMGLGKWLRSNRIPALEGIDTRSLTKILRERGTINGRIIIGKEAKEGKRNPIEEVSIKKPVAYGNGKKKVVLIDCGVKNSIMHSLLARGVSIIRVPWDYDIFLLKFDGLLVSNGPGDPKNAQRAIENVRKAVELDIPTFGICLGNQIMALAAGGDTYKMRYGHRSQNQPCILEGSKRCYITSQNHGYAASLDGAGGEWKPLFTNLNDG